MCTLKEIILVKYAAECINDFDIRSLVNRLKDETLKTAIRRKLSAFYIPSSLKDEIIALIKPIALEVNNWREDHIGIFTATQKFPHKFYFHANGTLDRIKTADLLIQSKLLPEEKRFLLACQYWSSREVLTFFENMRKTPRNRILRKYSKENRNLNEYEENVAKWIDHFRAGSAMRYDPWDDFTDVSLQSRRLEDLSKENCKSLLGGVFEDTEKMHVGRFCLSRMSADHQEDVLKHFPLNVLRIYLFRPYHQFFMNAANRVWDRLSGKDFDCLLHIIICQKILGLWEDFNYVDLLRQFWCSSPEYLKQYIESTDIFQILIEMVKNEFYPKFAPTYFFLHAKCFEDNAVLCNDITK
ncbi:uncharacterized protein TNCT_689891 [Trichonephila clavata]|uniref:Uncharacterized protein n=1 Tax=Trichonephila clavata TaxID=2740835 RepID=A0A8X6KYR5_TRICU|nr:uncharacterized protein TNCT_689891 [Trichonephila clavata]